MSFFLRVMQMDSSSGQLKNGVKDIRQCKTECSGIKVRVKASETFFYIPMYTKCEKNSVRSESGGGVSNGKSDYDL